MKSQNCDIWKKRISQFVITPAAPLALFTAGCSSIPQTSCYKREGLNPKTEAVIDEF